MHVDEAFKEYLKEQPFAVLCLEMDLGNGSEAVLLVKGTRDLIEGLQRAEAAVHLGWTVRNTPSGPVACLVLVCRTEGVGELAGETYFDVGSEEDHRLLQSLGIQAQVPVAFLDEDLQVAWFRKVEWSEVQRIEADQVLDRAEEFLERTEHYDFDAARAAFQEEVSLDQLIAALRR